MVTDGTGISDAGMCMFQMMKEKAGKCTEPCQYIGRFESCPIAQERNYLRDIGEYDPYADRILILRQGGLGATR